MMHGTTNIKKNGVWTYKNSLLMILKFIH